ncbi:histidinol-phosphate transaminase [Thalassobacillus pellis]|uniref:histidinol-phosphate transaminase n=1 Tax=Thalassobacillus pellis TaxID=748008 RepID=UPI00195F3FC1|nr:histidinol-phosphate transaminase [Thalassobacillus pellis]MBM7552469.1 histidinol-phosphate aminotransferase [Thalassobacillus pellis]
MKAKEILKSMSPYKPGKQIDEVKKEFGLEKIVKLASNENPFGFSPQVKKELPNLITGLEKYPDGYGTELRKKLSQELNIKEEELIFGNGSDEIVQIICRTFLEPGTNTVMATPTFPQYKHNALIEGAELREVPTKEGYHDLDEMLHQVDNNTRVLWLCTPNNPTGAHISSDEMEKVLSECPEHVLIVIDEAYYEYMDASDAFDAVGAIGKHPNLIVLRTFSKAYGLAGLRIGYGIAAKELIATLDPAREPFNTSTIAQAAAILALDDKEFLNDSIARNKENREMMMKFCKVNDLGFYDTQANFMLIHLPVSGDSLFQHLIRKGFIVRSGEALGIPNSIRLTIGSKEVMKEIQQEMLNFLESTKTGVE